MILLFFLYFRVIITLYNGNHNKKLGKEKGTMIPNPSLFVRIKDTKTGEISPMDCSSLGGSFIDSAVSGALFGIGVFAANLVINGVNKLVAHFGNK